MSKDGTLKQGLPDPSRKREGTRRLYPEQLRQRLFQHEELPDRPAMVAAARLVRRDDAFDLGHFEPARTRARRGGRARLRLFDHRAAEPRRHRRHDPPLVPVAIFLPPLSFLLSFLFSLFSLL